MRLNRWQASGLIVTALLMACHRPVQDVGYVVADIPSDYPMLRRPDDLAVPVLEWELDPGRSDLEVRVYRDGPMARLGHNHIIHAGTMMGRATTTQNNHLVADLLVPVASLVVDDPVRRLQAGDEFDSQPDDSDRSGTRQNMLSATQLNAASHPWLRARIDSRINDSLLVSFEVAGFSVSLPVAVSIESSGTALIARGQMTLSHEQLGLSVFTAAGGLIRVAETLDVRFELVFRRPLR